MWLGTLRGGYSTAASGLLLFGLSWRKHRITLGEASGSLAKAVGKHSLFTAVHKSLAYTKQTKYRQSLRILFKVTDGALYAITSDTIDVRQVQEI